MDMVFIAEFNDGKGTWFEVFPGETDTSRKHYKGGRWTRSDDPRLREAGVVWGPRMIDLVRQLYEKKGKPSPF